MAISGCHHKYFHLTPHKYLEEKKLQINHTKPDDGTKDKIAPPYLQSPPAGSIHEHAVGGDERAAEQPHAADERRALPVGTLQQHGNEAQSASVVELHAVRLEEDQPVQE